MARKTISVEKVREMANAFLANENTTADEREGVCALVESVLLETGNYQGFRYLDLKMDEDGNVECLGSGSRRYYFG